MPRNQSGDPYGNRTRVFAVKEQKSTISTARSPVARLFCPLEYREIAARGYASRGLPMVLFILDHLSGQNAPLIPGLFERAVIASTKEAKP